MNFICMVFRGVDMHHSKAFATRSEAIEYAEGWTLQIAGTTPYDVVVKELR